MMLFAFDFIQHIPCVNLTGFVKTSTREQWLARLGKGADRAKASLEVEEELKAVRGLPDKDL